MSYIIELKKALNEIKYVSTEEYKKECEYIEFKESMKSKVKLKCYCDESIDEKIQRLIQNNYENNCNIDAQQLDFSEDTSAVKKTMFYQKQKDTKS